MKTSLLASLLACVACGAASEAPRSSPDAADGAATCGPFPSLTCPDPQHPPSYASDVAPVIRSHCTPCHFPGGVVYSLYNLSDYVDLVDAQTAVLSQLYACTMPPTEGNAQYGIAPGTVASIPTAQATIILNWIGCGAPDN